MMVSMVGQDSVYVVDVETSVVPNVGDEVAYNNRLYEVVGRRMVVDRSRTDISWLLTVRRLEGL